MHVTFIFPDWTEPEPWGEKNKQKFGVGHFNFAIATLSAVLKEKGHTTSLIHVCFEPEERDFRRHIRTQYSETNLFAFSFSEVDRRWVKMMNRWIKKELGVLTIGGGIFPTLAPEECLLELELDMVCVGEGEYALPRVCEIIGQGREPQGVNNIFYRRHDKIFKNPTGEIVKDLDSLPLFDDTIFEPKRLKNLASNLPRLFYLCGRNCYFRCAFCSNHAKRGVYAAGKPFVRKHSPQRVVEDIKYFCQKYPQIKLVHFADECIHFDKNWFKNLMDLYSKEIGLPWRSYAMLKLLDQETVDIMKQSNCTRVNIGIEAGALRVRNLYCRPYMTSDEIITKVSMLKKAGINVHSSTLLNAPTETLQEMLDTIKLAARVNTDIPVCGIVVPYQGTKLERLARDRGLISDVKYENSGVSITPADCSKTQVIFLYHSYRFMIEIYKFFFRYPSLEKFIPIFEAIMCSRFIPKKVLIYIHKHYLFGYLLNRSYRRAEKMLGRNEVKYKESISPNLYSGEACKFRDHEHGFSPMHRERKQ